MDGHTGSLPVFFLRRDRGVFKLLLRGLWSVEDEIRGVASAATPIDEIFLTGDVELSATRCDYDPGFWLDRGDPKGIGQVYMYEVKRGTGCGNKTKHVENVSSAHNTSSHGSYVRFQKGHSLISYNSILPNGSRTDSNSGDEFKLDHEIDLSHLL